MDSLRRLEEIFSRFPGIGPRQARRFVYYLMNKSPASIKEFSELVMEMKNSTSECGKCHRFFIGRSSGPCAICSDSTRDQSMLMIVARDSDFETIEKSSAYKGLYFILGGTVPILDNDPEKRIRLKGLLERISMNDDQYPLIKEIILSMNTTPDGEHTGTIVKEAIQKISKNPSVKITVLGKGLSTGAELEYVDGETIKNALKNRE